MQKLAWSANSDGDVTRMQMGYTLSKEYMKNGFQLVFVHERQLESCEDIKYIVLNRTGLLQQPDFVTKNTALLDRWECDENKLTSYYLDDLVIHFNQEKPVEFMRRCRNIVVNNYVIKAYIEKTYNINNIKIIGTHVNYDLIDSLPQAHFMPINPERVSILWASIGNLGLAFMEKLCFLLNKDSRFRNIDFLCVAVNIHSVKSTLSKYTNLNFHFLPAMPWGQFHQVAKIADIMINPVSREELFPYFIDEDMQMNFLSAKSEIKFSTAGALRIPLVSGNMRAYTEAIRHGHDGFLSDSPEEWMDILAKLASNNALREMIGNNARQRAETDYDYKKRTVEFIQAFTND